MELFASHPTGLGKLILFFPALMGCLFHNSLPTTPGRRGSEPSPQQRSAFLLSPPRAAGPSESPKSSPEGLAGSLQSKPGSGRSTPLTYVGSGALQQAEHHHQWLPRSFGTDLGSHHKCHLHLLGQGAERVAAARRCCPAATLLSCSARWLQGSVSGAGMCTEPCHVVTAQLYPGDEDLA